MDSYDRKEMWEGYRKKLSRLISTMEDDINYRLTANHWSKLEKDDPELEFVNDMVTGLSAIRDIITIRSQCATMKHRIEEEKKVRLQLRFEAWENGLCPKEVRPWMLYELSKIAEYKRDTGNIQRDTAYAILDYEEDNHIFDKDYHREGYPDDEPFRAWKVI